MGNQANPVDIAKAGIAEAKKRKVDAVIVDTAGRLQVGLQGTEYSLHLSHLSLVSAFTSLGPCPRLALQHASGVVHNSPDDVSVCQLFHQQ
jgi:hypothetical protein